MQKVFVREHESKAKEVSAFGTDWSADLELTDQVITGKRGE
jgi:hypothetical protein